MHNNTNFEQAWKFFITVFCYSPEIRRNVFWTSNVRSTYLFRSEGGIIFNNFYILLSFAFYLTIANFQMKTCIIFVEVNPCGSSQNLFQGFAKKDTSSVQKRFIYLFFWLESTPLKKVRFKTRLWLSVVEVKTSRHFVMTPLELRKGNSWH